MKITMRQITDIDGNTINRPNNSSLIPMSPMPLMPLPFLLTRSALRKHIIQNYGIYFWWFKWDKLHPGMKELERRVSAETDAPIFEREEFSRALAPVYKLDTGQRVREYIDIKDIGVLQEISQLFADSLMGDKASVRFIDAHRPDAMSKAEWKKSQMRQNIIKGMVFAGIFKQILKMASPRAYISDLIDAIDSNIPWEWNKDNKNRIQFNRSIAKILIKAKEEFPEISFDEQVDIAIHAAWNLTHGPDAWLIKGNN